MQDLRDLECLIALARHQHFARAAEACGLSQPAFSMRIKALEDRLNTRIVKRGNRFEGLTPEGEVVLTHAKSITSQVRAMKEQLGANAGEIAGSLTLGVIPTAGAYASQIAARLYKRHPRIRLRIETVTSLAILQGLDDRRFDAGVTYTEGVSEDLLDVISLYDERYVLLVPDSLDPGGDTITWEAAGALPLMLLEPDMQNRRIIDKAFRDIGISPRIVTESNGFVPAMFMASRGVGATVIPEVLATALGTVRNTRMLRLVDPEIEKSICFVARGQGARTPAVAALAELLSSES
ncbi:MAG: LysR family transcriptional regulator [Pseudomonadota bacterium]